MQILFRLNQANIGPDHLQKLWIYNQQYKKTNASFWVANWAQSECK